MLYFAIAFSRIARFGGANFRPPTVCLAPERRLFPSSAREKPCARRARRANSAKRAAQPARNRPDGRARSRSRRTVSMAARPASVSERRRCRARPGRFRPRSIGQELADHLHGRGRARAAAARTGTAGEVLRGDLLQHAPLRFRQPRGLGVCARQWRRHRRAAATPTAACRLAGDLSFVAAEYLPG